MWFLNGIFELKNFRSHKSIVLLDSNNEIGLYPIISDFGDINTVPPRVDLLSISILFNILRTS